MNETEICIENFIKKFNDNLVSKIRSNRYADTELTIDKEIYQFGLNYIYHYTNDMENEPKDNLKEEMIHNGIENITEWN